MCEDSSQKGYLLTSFSQPCLPVSTSGPTKILPFLFLGSQHDANNKQLLLEHNISYELNVSTSCPKPDFLQDSHFLRIAVNDNFSAKLLPYFGEAFRFIGTHVFDIKFESIIGSYTMAFISNCYKFIFNSEKVREVGGRVLVHCLAGISRSPTIVISYVMKYFHMHYDEAYRYVKTRRPTISPNINFVGQLLEFDLHLFGKRIVMRSPLRPIHVDENFDLLTSSTTASANSPLLKSSSSSCINSDSPSESGFPFPLNRSLPSLRLNKSAEEVKNTSSDFDCFLFEQTYKCCSSSKLPSSPVTPPSTPVEGPLTPFESEPEMTPFGCGLADKNYEGGRRSPFSSVNKENEGHVNRGRVPVSSREISVTRNRSCRLCEKVVFSKKESFDEDEEVVDSSAAALTNSTKQPLPNNNSENSLIKTTDNNKNPILPHPTLHTQLKRESSAPENGYVMKEDSLALPPKTVRSCSSTAATRKIEQHNLPHLPRSYSSSETYLNTRMRLEKQQASASGAVAGSNTRKSFSSDEVGRAFQGSCGPNVPPQTPTSAGIHKDSYTNPLELVRCDSWSTSGLGSEISDWDSVQGDIQSVEDAQGPFDAVFAEVFPGEVPGTTVFRKHQEVRKQDDKLEKSEQKISLRKTFSDNQNTSSVRKCCSTLVPPDQDSVGTSPAPRPVSLPGVSGTYNVTDSNSCSDMGVELEDHRNWSNEEVDKLGTAWEESVAKRIQIAFDEHPPVNPRTMGEDVKHFMTWYEINLIKEKDRLLANQLSVKEEDRLLSDQLSVREEDQVLSKQLSVKQEERVLSDQLPVKEEDRFLSDQLSVKEEDRVLSKQEDQLSVKQEERVLSDQISVKEEDRVLSKQVSVREEGQKKKVLPNQLSVKEKDLILRNELSSEGKENLCNEETENIISGSSFLFPDFVTTCPAATIKETNTNMKDFSETEIVKEISPKFGKSINDPFSSAASAGTTETLMKALEDKTVTFDFPKKESLHERWQWWDIEFKKKIKNIKKNVCLSPWDTNDEGDEEEPVGGNLTGFHLAQELMQSMEDLLEREISDIKQRASSLSARFGLHLPSESNKSEQFDSFPSKKEVCLSPSADEFVEHLVETRNKTNLTRIAPGTHVRSRSEPPSCVEECLYRVKSCPGITNCRSMEDPGKTTRIIKEVDFPYRFTRLFRTSKPGHHQTSKRYSCSALDFVVNPSIPSFDSCPDMSRAQNKGTPESLTPSSSFNRLLKRSVKNL
ncbi:Dual specificity protein phosphatase 16 [Armadillidium nasatum]|uniref:protein-tyrosine-phosphatase n=1 Tax=Armadillidium nasatum TaxID=96803 RepID=A0A5N5T140_9CRUS|nr:Dual specificity protein phosphatase 16 [Armadillidium nasatum]